MVRGTVVGYHSDNNKYIRYVLHWLWLCWMELMVSTIVPLYDL
jgi:hypothetical protein